MGELILCKNQMAAEPFYVEGAELHLYGMEELCWYILHNLYTADRDLMTPEFVDWVAFDLGELTLSERLSAVMRQTGGAYQFLMAVLSSCKGYVSDGELSEADRVLREVLSRSPFERGKLMADQDLKNGRFMRAVGAYRRLLTGPDCGEASPRMQGDVWHNLGVALAGMFLFEEAKEAFQKALGLNQSRATEGALRLAERICAGEDVFARKEDPRLVEALSKAAEARRLHDMDAFFEALQKYLGVLKEEYRNGGS